MKKIVAWMGVATILCATSAIAADMPVKAPPAPAATFNWTGFYVGANAGYGWGGRERLSGDGPNGSGAGSGSVILNAVQGIVTAPGIFLDHPTSRSIDEGFLGGGQLGYNWQLGPRWIAGFEADLQYSNVKGGTSLLSPGGGVQYRLTSSHRLEWLGTVRGRFGFLLTDRLLAFATGGLAYGKTQANASAANISAINNVLGGLATDLTCPAFNVCIAGSGSRTSVGWVAGGGIEYAAWNNVTVKIEYLRVDLNDLTFRLVSQPPATGNGYITARYDNSENIVRAGVNFKFAGP
jgi:outer membrane immunogenic protein